MSGRGVVLHVLRRGPGRESRFSRTVVADVAPEGTLLDAILRLPDDGAEGGAPSHGLPEAPCPDGRCGACGVVVDGVPVGRTCRLKVADLGGEVWLEPFRATALPPSGDLAVDRGALDRVVRDARGEGDSRRAADACLACAACVAACPNASAMLFLAAAARPGARPSRPGWALDLLLRADDEGFGACATHLECEAVCPDAVGASGIVDLRREVLGRARATVLRDPVGSDRKRNS